MKTVLFLLSLAQIAFSFPGYDEPWGYDSDLKAPSHTIEERESPHLAIRLADAIIRFHQTVISPVDGPRSHYSPSSSQYMYLAIHRFGFLKGFIMGCDRLLRENDEEWVYQKIEWGGKLLKYDPANMDKHMIR